ncbi:MAG: hypothetical protein R2939_14040 [Kofleriaceae bacterium]
MERAVDAELTGADALTQALVLDGLGAPRARPHPRRHRSRGGDGGRRRSRALLHRLRVGDDDGDVPGQVEAMNALERAALLRERRASSPRSPRVRAGRRRRRARWWPPAASGAGAGGRRCPGERRRPALGPRRGRRRAGAGRAVAGGGRGARRAGRDHRLLRLERDDFRGAARRRRRARPAVCRQLRRALREREPVAG